jgi:hypothetical protein
VEAASSYDPKIIERYAERLLSKADSVRVGASIAGGIVGVLIGCVPLTPLKTVWGVSGPVGVATILLGAFLGLLIGYVIGEGRAFRYRVEAQRALFQVDIEKRMTQAVVQAVNTVVSRVAAAQAPAPVPAEPAAPAAPAAAVEAPEPAPVTAPAVTSVPPISPAVPALRPPAAPALAAEGPDLPPLSPAASA